MYRATDFIQEKPLSYLYKSLAFPPMLLFILSCATLDGGIGDHKMETKSSGSLLGHYTAPESAAGGPDKGDEEFTSGRRRARRTVVVASSVGQAAVLVVGACICCASQIFRATLECLGGLPSMDPGQGHPQVLKHVAQILNLVLQGLDIVVVVAVVVVVVVVAAVAQMEVYQVGPDLARERSAVLDLHARKT